VLKNSKLLFKSILLITLFLGCQGKEKFTKTVNYVDLPKYMGTWYVHAGRFTPLEREVTNSIEKYTWNQDREIIEIDFTYNKGSFSGKRIALPQTGRVINSETNAHWKVSPIWFLQFDFLIIALDQDYQWTAIGVPDQSYLWIMTRSPSIESQELETIIKEVAKTGYDVDQLIYVPHAP
jgi:apolipoprotein D and lipocalin family protein